MAIIKCKMCGGDISWTDTLAIGTCEYCGSRQTLPSAADDQRANLFNRANHFRRLNDFDKAIGAFEGILNINHSDAEAHWGLVLSRFGIEYIEDPVTHERIPTCHRVQSESILADADYLAALQYAPDAFSKSVYEEEAGRIAEIQRCILKVSSMEEAYDVFICYKENDNSGARTEDSAIAQDIYYQLSKEGFKVFFSRISLENKLGLQYEPYIFAALNSARVMLVVGTRPEYFRAVWVKNEWSRFLALIKKEEGRLLIPCYRNFDAYELPDELSMLQSQDMGKIGFIQDLLYGIKKVINESAQNAPKASANAQMSAPRVESLYKRVGLFLEDGDFKQASVYCNRILDIDPEYAPAYIGLLCAQLGCRTESDLGLQKCVLTEQSYFKKAMRFAGSEYKEQITSYNQANLDTIKALEEKKRAEKKALEDKARAELNKKVREAIILIEESQLLEIEKPTVKRSKIKAIDNRILGLNNQIQDILQRVPVSIQIQEGIVSHVFMGKVFWRVLEINNNGTALMISEKIVDFAFFYHKNSPTWDNNPMRQYLNTKLINRQLSTEELEILVTTEIASSKNFKYKTDSGTITRDKTFLLSIEELLYYFPNENERAIGAPWWLRTPGKNLARLTYVDIHGRIDYKGHDYGCRTFGIRPAVWVDIN